jgi:hypothetical protein
MPKKGKKKKEDKPAEEKVEEKKPTLVPTERDTFVMLRFKLISQWDFLNFEQKFRDSTHIFTIKKLLREKHGRMADLKLCFHEFSDSKRVANEMLTLKECGCEGQIPAVKENPNGTYEFDEATIPKVDLMYDFTPENSSDPILLFYNPK